MPKKFLLTLVTCTLICLIGIGVLVQYTSRLLTQPIKLAENMHTATILIRPGDSFDAVVEKISEHTKFSPTKTHLIVLKVWNKFQQIAPQLKAGEYELSNPTTLQYAFTQFASGKTKSYFFQILEGSKVDDVLNNLSKEEKLRHSITSSRDLAVQLGVNNAEGWLFPDTYQYVRGESDLALMRRAHMRMQNKLQQAWLLATSKEILKSAYELLILASIIEKETALESDRVMVSAVFHNRLRKGMKLQTDPTVIYGIKNFDGDIKRKHLKMPHPYNTYVHYGLPPTPIALPSFASLKAAAAPSSVSYLYFVAKGQGELGSVFSNTLHEHNKAVDRYQR